MSIENDIVELAKKLPGKFSYQELKLLLAQGAYIKRAILDAGGESFMIRYQVENGEWRGEWISEEHWTQLRDEEFIVFEEETHIRLGRGQRWVYWEEMYQG